jgi:3-mercaptopropionate dioxygenase
MSTPAAANSVYGLREFVHDVERVLAVRPSVPVVVRELTALTGRLVADDRWLEERHRIGSPDRYTRHLLHRDALNRFVVLSLVWQPGQATPIHDHACWGTMGILHNRLREVTYDRLDDGSRPEQARLELVSGVDVERGGIGQLLPPYEDIHRIGNFTDKETISIHVYGRDLDVINVYDVHTGKVSPMRIKYYSPECSEVRFEI